MERDQRLYGEPARPAPIRLKAGQLTAEFEPDSGWLRYVRVGDREVIRAIYAIARYPTWATPKAVITNVEVDQDDESFVISFDATVELDLPFRWRGSIEGDGEGFCYRMSGWATEAFETNRTGVCVLHPVTMRGEPCTVTHPDGTTSELKFPVNILPHVPFTNIAGLTTPGCRMTFVGEVFETEDQRNWTDASFKTYSRLAERPRPYPIAAGERIDHEVRIELTPVAPLPPAPKPSAKPLPWIGLSAPTGVVMDAVSTSNFTELNAARPEKAEHVMFAANPQVHAFDWKTMIESLETLPDCVRTAQEFAANVHVGPITLNAADNDPRWDSLLAAGWVLGCVGVLTEAGVASISFSQRANDYPVKLVLEDLESVAGRYVTVMHDAHPLKWMRLAFDGMLLVANLSTAEIEIPGLPAGRVRVVDEDTVAALDWKEFAGGSLRLRPCAYARIDG